MLNNYRLLTKGSFHWDSKKKMVHISLLTVTYNPTKNPFFQNALWHTNNDASRHVFFSILQLINMWDKTSSSVLDCQLLPQYQFTAIFWLQQAVTNSKTLHWVLDTTDAKLISCLTGHENKFHSSSTHSECTFFNSDLTSKYAFIFISFVPAYIPLHLLKQIWNSHHYILSYATVLSGRLDQTFQGKHYICHQGSALLVVLSYYSGTFTTVATSNLIMWECTFADSPTI